jgi:calcineurin-like phosphoesterase family protein
MKYFLADTHFGHSKVILDTRRHPKYGVFTTVKEHDDAIIESINNRVGKRDQLYLLGDVGFNPGRYRPRIKCKNVVLIRGNHDRHQKSINVFGEYHEILVVKLMNHSRCVLCHYPLAYWPSSHHGTYHLYGHVHGNREQTLDKAFPGRRSLDVTIDNLVNTFGMLGPISEEEIILYFSDKHGHDHVIYYENLRRK